MFVDASAIVAMIAHEAGSDALAAKMEAAEHRLTSAIAILEATMALHRLRSGTIADAEALVRSLMATADIGLAPIADREARAAVAAYARYGKGQGHPARLNLGDCFAYACARTHDVPLLFVGGDFPQTDIASATA